MLREYANTLDFSNNDLKYCAMSWAMDKKLSKLFLDEIVKKHLEGMKFDETGKMKSTKASRIVGHLLYANQLKPFLRDSLKDYATVAFARQTLDYCWMEPIGSMMI
jgi:hypothetical protein